MFRAASSASIEGQDAMPQMWYCSANLPWYGTNTSLCDVFFTGMEESVIEGASLMRVDAYFGRSERRSAVFVAQSLYVTYVLAESAVKSKVDSDCDALCRVFDSQLQELHLQAYIVTGSPHAASECVAEAFETLQNAFLASPEFAYEAAKLATIKCALRRVASDIRHHAFHDAADNDRRHNHYHSLEPSGLEEACRERFLTSILQLNAFHRAVLLLRMYEHYRVYFVALLLRLPLSTIEQGITKAVELLVVSIHGTETHNADRGSGAELMPLHS